MSVLDYSKWDNLETDSEDSLDESLKILSTSIALPLSTVKSYKEKANLLKILIRRTMPNPYIDIFTTEGKRRLQFGNVEIKIIGSCKNKPAIKWKNDIDVILQYPMENLSYFERCCREGYQFLKLPPKYKYLEDRISREDTAATRFCFFQDTIHDLVNLFKQPNLLKSYESQGVRCIGSIGTYNKFVSRKSSKFQRNQVLYEGIGLKYEVDGVKIDASFAIKGVDLAFLRGSFKFPDPLFDDVNALAHLANLDRKDWRVRSIFPSLLSNSNCGCDDVVGIGAEAVRLLKLWRLFVENDGVCIPELSTEYKEGLRKLLPQTSHWCGLPKSFYFNIFVKAIMQQNNDLSVLEICVKFWELMSLYYKQDTRITIDFESENPLQVDEIEDLPGGEIDVSLADWVRSDFDDRQYIIMQYLDMLRNGSYIVLANHPLLPYVCNPMRLVPLCNWAYSGLVSLKTLRIVQKYGDKTFSALAGCCHKAQALGITDIKDPNIWNL